MLKLKKIESVLLFLILLFLPTQLGRHFWPQFSYIYSLKIDYLSPTLYFWDILVVCLWIVWFLRKPKVNKLAFNIFLLFLFTQILSLLGSSNIGAGLIRIEQYIVAGSFGVYLASEKFKIQSAKLYWPLLLGILGESLIAFLQFIKGQTLGLWILGERSFSISTPGIAKFDFYGYEFLRPYATFPHPNVLAGFMLVGICIMYQVLREKQRIVTLALVFGSITIFLTMSRTVILAAIITLFILLRRKWMIVTTKSQALLIIIITIILFPILFTRFISLLNFDNLTLLRREELAGSAWQMFVASPVFGIGLNNFIPVVANQLVSGPSRFLQPVHNIFLLALSETGILGLLGLLWLVAYPIVKLFRLNPKPYPLNLFLLSWLIILFLGMFDHYFLTLPQGYRLLFLIWGLSFSMLKYSGESHFEDHS